MITRPGLCRMRSERGRPLISAFESRVSPGQVASNLTESPPGLRPVPRCEPIGGNR